jgi:hypothetical protein
MMDHWLSPFSPKMARTILRAHSLKSQRCVTGISTVPLKVRGKVDQYLRDVGIEIVFDKRLFGIL